MTRPAITVENLSKAYHIGLKQDRADTLVGALQGMIRAPLAQLRHMRRMNTFKHQEDAEDIYWALKDVSFEVAEGEVVGIIGRNGAGKSTLLKILSRITEPTSGRAVIRGRVSSLLEVGTGFHQELSGRENVYMNGTILGMTKREIDRKFDEIVDFSGVEKFLDTPIKHYSSGMKVRLAFAVAAHLEPEILIIDEVLAVGDAEFQTKCVGKMQDVARRGRTVLFVSHNMAAVTSLTSKCIYLNQGCVQRIGDTDTVIEDYLGLMSDGNQLYRASTQPHTPHIRQVKIDFHRNSSFSHVSGEPFEVEVVLEHRTPLKGACFSIQIVNFQQVPICHCWLYDIDQPICRTTGPTKLRCQIDRLDLNVGHYSLNAYFSEPPGGQMFDQQNAICPFEVVVTKKQTLFGWRPNACSYLVDFKWTAESCESTLDGYATSTP